MRRLIWTIFLSALLPGTASGQAAQDSWDNLSQLQAGQRIQVVDMDWKSLQGKFVRISDDAISFETKGGEVTLKRDRVFRVSLSSGGAGRAKNAALGAVVGAAAGLIAGRAWSTKTQPTSAGDYAEGAACAAAIGAGVGSAFPGWHTVYRARRPSKKER